MAAAPSYTGGSTAIPGQLEGTARASPGRRAPLQGLGRVTWPQVVAAELNSRGSKEIAMFIVRVADDSGEWTVTRRFRHFETLHRAMRAHSAMIGLGNS